MKLKIIFIPASILVIGFVVMLLLFSFQQKPEQRAPALEARTVEVEEVKFADIPTNIIAYGRLKTSQPIILYSEVQGELKKGNISFLPGQSFKKGDLLLKIDDRQMILDINSAKSDFLNALATVLPEIKVDFPDEFTIWETYFNSCGFEHELAPLPQTTNQKIKLFLSRFNVYKLFFSISNQEIQLQKHYFYAPFDGSIITTDLSVGSTSRPGSRLGEIINIEKMEVEIPLPVQDIQWIDQRKPVILHSEDMPGEWVGNINRISTNIDERTQTVNVYIGVPQAQRRGLLNGIFMQAQLPGKIIKNAVSIPRRIIYNDSYVYVIQQGKLTYRQVQIARRETDTAIINAGFQQGDSLVTEVLQGVANGMPARVKTNLSR